MSHGFHVGVLGAGRWGLALATASQRAGNTVLLCTRREEVAAPEGVQVTGDFTALARATSLILVAVPPEVVRGVARALGDAVNGSHLLVHGIRGLSAEGLSPISEVLREETPCRRVGALGGPAFATDLLEGRHGLLSAASHYPEVTAAVRSALVSPTLRVQTSTDLTGLEWASALIGCLFVAIGYAREIGVGPALLGGFLSLGLHEAARIAAAAGAEEKTFFDLGGLGDLMAAMSQEDRPEVLFGKALARGATLDGAREAARLRIEAPTLIPRVITFARERRLQTPIFSTLGAVLEGRVDRNEVLDVLMTGRPSARA